MRQDRTTVISLMVLAALCALLVFLFSTGRLG
jgi:hypothetical protein